MNFINKLFFQKQKTTPQKNQEIDTTKSQDKNLISLHGSPFIVDPLDSLGLINNPIFEPEETLLCQTLITSGDTCLDIGANIGYYTTLFANIVGKKGKVVAIEPDAENFTLLSRNCSPYLDGNIITIRQIALGATSGQASLYKSKDNHGMHRLYPSICCSTDSTEVSVIKGDDLNIGTVDFIKIDIEGYEFSALSGLVNTIKTSHELKILTEFSPLSILEAGFSPMAFIEMLFDYGLVPLENVNNRWQSIELKSFLDSIAATEQIELSSIKENMETESNLKIYEKASNILNEKGYTRPLLENLIWISPAVLDEVKQKLKNKDLLG